MTARAVLSSPFVLCHVKKFCLKGRIKRALKLQSVAMDGGEACIAEDFTRALEICYVPIF